MPIIGRLTAIYRSRGIEIATGLNPSHFDDFPLAPFTWFLKDGESLTNGLGIALQEIYFLECLFARYRPAHLFAIGNAMGWSTLALGLLNPQGKVLAIDAGLDRNSLAGIDFTNAAALKEALPVTVLRGRSPEDVGHVIGEQAMLPIDFAFIDGHHSTEQVAFDFGALRPHAAANCVYLFHDVATFALAPAIERLAAEIGFRRACCPARIPAWHWFTTRAIVRSCSTTSPRLPPPRRCCRRLERRRGATATVTSRAGAAAS